jgi:hypothetical protein
MIVNFFILSSLIFSLFLLAAEETTPEATAKPVVLSLTHPQYERNTFHETKMHILIFRNSEILKCTLTIFGSDITAAVNTNKNPRNFLL